MSTLIRKLHEAVAENDHIAVKALVASGANLDEICDGQTALHIAASFGFSDCIETLLELGADPRIENDAWLEPQDIAYRMGHDGGIEFLPAWSSRVWAGYKE